MDHNKLWKILKEMGILDHLGFPGGSAGKECACNAGDLDSNSGLGRSPGEWNGYPVFLPGEFHGQRNQAGYNPWGCKESDTTERLTLFLKFKHLAHSIPQGITSSCELRSPSLLTLLGGRRQLGGGK